MDIILNEDQVYALYELERWWNEGSSNLFQLSGAAGTGKTTLIRFFIDKIGLELNECAFIAFQGKAAMQMAKNGLPAQTIHSLIYNPEEVYEKDENGPIILKNGKLKKKIKFKLKKSLDDNLKLIVIDEGSMVSEKISKDILSFNLPVVVLGDLNQLPPVTGNPYFLTKPNYVLKQIMRQSKDNPIIWLSQKAIEGEKLSYGTYGSCSVIRKKDLDEYMLNEADIVLTPTNNLRNKINELFRQDRKSTRLNSSHT